MSRTITQRTGCPIVLTNDDTGEKPRAYLDFDARVPVASASLPGGSKLAVTGSDGTNYSIPASVVASSVNIEADVTRPGLTVNAGNPGYQAIGFDRALVPAAVLDVTPKSNAVTITAAQLLATDKVRIATGSATGPITATIETGVSKSLFSVVNNSAYSLTVIMAGQTTPVYTLPRGGYGIFTTNGTITVMLGQDNASNLAGSVYSTMDTDGLVRGNLGSHACGPTEFIHYPCDDQTGPGVPDKTCHFPGVAKYGTLQYSNSNLPANLGGALTFDGVYAISPENLNLSDWGELTVAMWVRPVASVTTTQFIVSNCGSATTNGGFFIAAYNTNNLQVGFNGQTASINNFLAAGSWVHVVVSIRRDKFIRISVNGGAKIAEVPITGTPLSFNYGIPILIGQRGVTGYAFSGDVADFRLYNRALSPQEADFLYNGGAGRKTPLTVATQLADSPWSEVFDYQTTNPANTYQFTSNDARLQPGTPIRFRQNQVNYYAVVVANSGGTISIAGAPLLTGYPIGALAVGQPGNLHVEWITLSGQYAAGLTAPATLQNRAWLHGPAALVRFVGRLTTSDTGAQQPKINVKVGGQYVSTNDSGNGVTLATAGFLPDLATAGAANVAISPTYYSASLGTAVDLFLTNTGTNKNSADLRVGLIWVLK